MAKSAKGGKRKYEVAVSLWVDLLGYGAMLEAAQWDPTSPEAELALERIVRFQEVVAKHSNRHFPTFVMNDGAIVYRDLSPRDGGVTLDFLLRSIDLYHEINQIEKSEGHPGARAVLAAGFRVRRIVDYSKRLNAGEGKRIKEKLEAGEIGGMQAINHALMARHHADSTLELQHNYAMTKAYLVDAIGTKGGFGGPNLFIDENIFKNKIPDWIQISETIGWHGRGMEGSFGKFEIIKPCQKIKCAGDMRDAFELATALSPNPNILEIVRGSKLGNLRGAPKAGA
ncbi:hypothetical protein [Burkholderia seminalis]|uniref:hypothetical protein n=1 Tax=Burkholderia seminalis TaxID=488731 RepID=UPI00190883B6|nr:hypothetical protein [Burkholderia seminalis]MBJ9594792.1 hypothetical protein [Burkholderia seminalis]